MVILTVNGQEHSVDVAPSTPLLWLLRDRMDLTGTKFGCGIGLCGACTVILDDNPVRACQTTLADAAGHHVTTIEGVGTSSADAVGTAVQAAWRKLDVVQCGYCQSGQILSAIALLKGNPRPTDADIDSAMDGNLCRCATYLRIKKAIHAAALSLGR